MNALNNRIRLDQELVNRKLATSRSQAESLIGLGMVKVNKITVLKPSQQVKSQDVLTVIGEQYVSRAAYKLESVAGKLRLDFRGKVVLDIGSSTGGFTDYVLQNGAKKFIAGDVGTDQMHPKLRNSPQVELHEKTDIRNVCLRQTATRNILDLREVVRSEGELTRAKTVLSEGEVSEDTSREEKPFVVELLRSGDERALRKSSRQLAISVEDPDVVLIDVSFISLRDILPHISQLVNQNSLVLAMAKPQFEAGKNIQKNRGVIKNERQRREILRDFETWVQKLFKVIDKSDSMVAGTKGNLERFYLLKKL